MAVWTGWRNPTVDPVDGDWDFQVFDGMMSLCKLVSGQWVKVVTFAAEGSNVGLVDADKLDGQHGAYYEPAFSKNTAFNKNLGTAAGTVAEGNHAHSGIAGLTKNYYKVYDNTSLAVGTHTIDLNGHVPAGSTAAFIRWTGFTAGGTRIYVKDYAESEIFYDEIITSGNYDVGGSCIVPLDASYRFKFIVVGVAISSIFTLAVTYVG